MLNVFFVQIATFLVQHFLTTWHDIYHSYEDVQSTDIFIIFKIIVEFVDLSLNARQSWIIACKSVILIVSCNSAIADSKSSVADCKLAIADRKTAIVARKSAIVNCKSAMAAHKSSSLEHLNWILKWCSYASLTAGLDKLSIQ